MVETTEENDDILGVALPTKDMFDTLNSHFAGIHSLISKAKPEETTLQAETATSEYIKFYRQCFPNRIIAKQYILKRIALILCIGQVLD